MISIDLFKRPNTDSTTRTYTDWSNYDNTGLKSYLSSTPWHNFDNCNDVNDQLDFIYRTINAYLDSAVHEKTVLSKPSHKWFTREHSELKQRKIVLKVK